MTPGLYKRPGVMYTRTMSEGTYTVDVGWTNTRPVIADEHRSRVTVIAGSDAEAHELAMIMVNLHAPAGWAPCEMPTSSKIVNLVV